MADDGFQSMIALVQRNLCHFARGDVTRDAEYAEDLSVGVADRPFGGEEDFRSVGGVQCFLVGFGLAGGDYPAADRHQHLRLIWREESTVVVA